jgi:hypothetical protein
MSVNFCDDSGIMAGMDNHIFLVLAPPAIPVPTPAVHFVGLIFKWPPSVKRASTLTSDSWKMEQDGFDCYLVPHIPFPPGPAHPGELAWWATMVFLPSGTKCPMSVHKVTGDGEPLATCLVFCIGMNMNCNDPCDLPTDLVFNMNTVKTQPTLGDYLGALFGAALDSAIGWAFGKALGPAKNWTKRLGQNVAKQLLRRFPDLAKALGDPGIADPPGLVKKLVQRVVDGEPVFGG